jgi:hypothetical protein
VDKMNSRIEFEDGFMIDVSSITAIKPQNGTGRTTIFGSTPEAIFAVSNEQAAVIRAQMRALGYATPVEELMESQDSNPA